MAAKAQDGQKSSLTARNPAPAIHARVRPSTQPQVADRAGALRAASAARAASPRDILALQRVRGNLAVNRLLQRATSDLPGEVPFVEEQTTVEGEMHGLQLAGPAAAKSLAGPKQAKTGGKAAGKGRKSARSYSSSVNLKLLAIGSPDRSLTTAEISNRAGDSSGTTAGLTRFRYAYETGVQQAHRGSKHWITAISVRLKNVQFKIYLTNANKPNSCADKDLLRHEMHHVQDAIDATAATQADLRGALAPGAWPDAAHPVDNSVITQADLRKEITTLIARRMWEISYNFWLYGSAWDTVDYPRMYAKCPGMKPLRTAPSADQTGPGEPPEVFAPPLPMKGPAGPSDKAKPQPPGGSKEPEASPVPGKGREVPLQDEDAQQSYRISTAGEEFRNNYIDNNIETVDYYSSPFAAQIPEHRKFWVNYSDGRRLEFSTDTIPVRRKQTSPPGYISVKFEAPATKYFKRGGFIYPNLYNESNIPTLISIATTVALNHLLREQRLEIAEVTSAFSFLLSVNISSLAAIQSLASGGALRAGGGIGGLRRPAARGSKPGGAGGDPIVEAELAQTNKAKLVGKASAGTGGATKSRSTASKGGNPKASLTGRTRTEVGGERGPKPLTSKERQLAQDLYKEHSQDANPSPRFAEEAARGAKARGKERVPGGEADLILSNGKVREVRVFQEHVRDWRAIELKLVEKQRQAKSGGEIYVQITAPDADKAAIVQGATKLQLTGSVDLAGTSVRIYGPDAKVWWSGTIKAPAQ